MDIKCLLTEHFGRSYKICWPKRMIEAQMNSPRIRTTRPAFLPPLFLSVVFFFKPFSSHVPVGRMVLYQLLRILVLKIFRDLTASLFWPRNWAEWSRNRSAENLRFPHLYFLHLCGPAGRWDSSGWWINALRPLYRTWWVEGWTKKQSNPLGAGGETALCLDDVIQSAWYHSALSKQTHLGSQWRTLGGRTVGTCLVSSRGRISAVNTDTFQRCHTTKRLLPASSWPLTTCKSRVWRFCIS